MEGMLLEWDGERKERKEKYVDFHDVWLASQPLSNHRQVAGKQQARPGNATANTRQSRVEPRLRRKQGSSRMLTLNGRSHLVEQWLVVSLMP